MKTINYGDPEPEGGTWRGSDLAKQVWQKRGDEWFLYHCGSWTRGHKWPTKDTNLWAHIYFPMTRMPDAS